MERLRDAIIMNRDSRNINRASLLCKAAWLVTTASDRPRLDPSADQPGALGVHVLILGLGAHVDQRDPLALLT